MISFVSTFPPAMCGIGTYTKYLTSCIQGDQWSVIAFQPDEFSTGDGNFGMDKDRRVDYWISLENPSLPPWPIGDVLWFQHSFGMWGRVNTQFLRLIEEARSRGKKVGASFHTIHFESEETPWGMQKKEVDLLREALPLLDFVTVFTIGARRAVIDAFPGYSEKVLVLRHGVHQYPKITKEYAREKLFNYLSQLPSIPPHEKIRLSGIEKSLVKGSTVLLGNYGFITQDKDPIQLYEIGMEVRKRLPRQREVTLFVGKIQERKDKKREVCLPILEKLKSIHDGKENLFYEDFIPEKIFPFAFRALDVAVFWCNNATQSGRMAHAQGTGVAIAGRKLEGIGETLELSNLPALSNLDELAGKIAEIVREPKLEERMEEQSRRYADRYSFYNQAKKHLMVEQAIRSGARLPVLDGEVENDIHTRKIGHWGYRRFGTPGERVGISA
ncbi:MAG: hypothetical protein HXY46_03065 [Syntrophaceae bacterium]|nr:hypothetical protein [Syntrophaceae bacterium]